MGGNVDGIDVGLTHLIGIVQAVSTRMLQEAAHFLPTPEDERCAADATARPLYDAAALSALLDAESGFRSRPTEVLWRSIFVPPLTILMRRTRV
jgi:hypothetical protein